MPTASKLFAAFGLALVALFAAEIFKQYMPEGTQFGAFVPVSMLIGLVCGWRVLGPETGKGYWESANAGLKAAIAMTLLALIIFSIEEMVVVAFRKMYDGPMEAVIGAIGIGVGFVRKMFVPDVLAVIFGGGMLAGCLSEWASRRWR